MNAMYVMPAPLALVLGVALLVAFAFAMHWVLGRWFTSDDLAVHNYVAGTIVGVVGTLYAVVLGFITVVVWQQYDGTRERLALETAAVTDTWHTAVGLPPPVRSRLRRDIFSYATLMRDKSGGRCAWAVRARAAMGRSWTRSTPLGRFTETTAVRRAPKS